MFNNAVDVGKLLFFRILVILFVLCLFPSSSSFSAARISLTWDPPAITTDVAGYMIHYGTASRAYSQSIDVGNVTSYTVSNLDDGLTYYFAATAYNAAGSQSVYSNEVSLTMAPVQYLLLVLNPGPGEGTVAGLGINCGATCLAVQNPGAIVTLTAAAAPGSTFNGWSGGGCSGSAEVCTVVMYGNTTVTANFTAAMNTTVSTTTVPPTTPSTSGTTSTPTTAVPSHTIYATANGEGGNIFPSDESTVSHGGMKTFRMIPFEGGRVVDVVVDGMSVGAVASYTFDNVDANHTITAVFTY